MCVCPEALILLSTLVEPESLAPELTATVPVAKLADPEAVVAVLEELNLEIHFKEKE